MRYSTATVQDPVWGQALVDYQDPTAVELVACLGFSLTMNMLFGTLSVFSDTALSWRSTSERSAYEGNAIGSTASPLQWCFQVRTVQSRATFLCRCTRYVNKTAQGLYWAYQKKLGTSNLTCNHAIYWEQQLPRRIMTVLCLPWSLSLQYSMLILHVLSIQHSVLFASAEGEDRC